MSTGMTPNHNLSIPPLMPGERIANWKPLFLAAVAPLIEQKAEHKAIQILPAFICRRPAERELVREVVIEEHTLQEAFDILIESLDPPQDLQQQMLALCRSDWKPGQPIDDFFYEIKRAAEKAEAPVNMVAIILINQLPGSIQSSLQEWIKTHPVEDRVTARTFISKVRMSLVEKGIALDRGNRDFNRVAKIQQEVVTEGEPNLKPKDAESRNDIGERSQTSVNMIQRGGYTRRRSGFRGYGVRGGFMPERRAGCWICGDIRHFIRDCPKQCCNKCGERGHSLWNCKSKGVFTVNSVKTTNIFQENEAGVVISVTLEGNKISAMLDSGAQPSVIDRKTMYKFNIPFKQVASQVHGLCSSPVKVCGEANMSVDVGSGEAIEQFFWF